MDPTPRPPGRPRQTIRHGYAETLKTFYGEGNTSFNHWMEEAKNPNAWKDRVEDKLGLKPGTYKIALRRTQANNRIIN